MASNPIQQLILKKKEVETGIKAWSMKQSLPVVAVVGSTMGGVNGALTGSVMGILTAPGMPLGPQPLVASRTNLAQAALVGASEYSTLFSVQVGISYIMERTRGKTDLMSTVVAAAGSGFAHAMWSQGLQGKTVDALSSAAKFAVYAGIGYQLGETIKLLPQLGEAIKCLPQLGETIKQTIKQSTTPQDDDPFYTQSRAMLLKLGLEEYIKNFKHGRLTDATLPLLTDWALKEVSIPVGPRLVILDHIQRFESSFSTLSL